MHTPHDRNSGIAQRGLYSFVLWVLVAALTAGLIWAYVYRIDQVTRGTGTVIASSRVQVIQAVDGGVLKSLKVKEGDQVTQGEVLAVLDQTRFAAQVKELDARLEKWREAMAQGGREQRLKGVDSFCIWR